MTDRIEWKIVYRHFAAGNSWEEKLTWCRENLYHGGNYEPNWKAEYPFIVFEDEKEYAWFNLAWE